MKIQLKAIRLTTRLDKRFTDPVYIRKTFESRYQKTRLQTNAVLKDLVEKELRKHKVVRALISPSYGVRGEDLQAEFGLRPGEGERAAELLISILLYSCRVYVETEAGYRTVRGRPSAAVVVRAEFLNPNDYLRFLLKPPFFYYSEPKNTLIGKENSNPKIEWMKWLLEANKGINTIFGSIPSVKDYGINYSLTGFEKAASRSGRAVMVQDKQANRDRIPIKHRQYEFPTVAVPRPGYRNFIDEIANNAQFLKKLQMRMETIATYYLTPRKR